MFAKVNLRLAIAFSAVAFLLNAVCAADKFQDPMQPPAFALKQFKLAKLKHKAVGQKKIATVKKAPVKPLRLSTILIGQQRRVAIINGRMLVTGDIIENARLVKIQKDRVELVRKGKRINLKLEKDFISIRKSPAKSNL